MRKAQKKQAEDFAELLGQAHSEIRKEMEQKNISNVLSLLADCQEGAMSLGELIEKTEGEEAPTIPLLERYCEEVYRIYENLAQGNPMGANKVYKNLRQWELKLKSSVRNEIRIRLEVVFLPYKASMWDSLESVWKAADADPDCDPYVIPIPYYDKKPDGSFGEMHNEFSQYPSYVPLTWYEEYDFEKRRPDMIFIHNPYDECNYVTSVEPFFYSKNLKKYTDKLVYIPYFILGEIDPENPQELEGIEKFCQVPGVLYADKVIVQSEEMRQAYIKVMTAFMAGQQRYDRGYWEKKILGLGSPKVDKVLNTRKEELTIPEEWMKIIRKPDGSWKKIIFYNTTVTALLEHNEKMLEKMRDVFRIFWENRDEVALLWRPHPLIKATIESMRPQLWEEYEKIVKKYREESWGIYDDTADLDRAVKLSDGYYGDPSSVVQLCQKAGMPVMMQDVEMPSSKRYMCEITPAEAICRYQDNYYFVYRNAPVLGRMKRGTLACEFLYRFQGEKAGSRLYRKLIPYQNKLFAIPFFAEQIAVYDIASGTMYFIPLNEEYMNRGRYPVLAYFQDALQQGRFLYLVPYCYSAMIRIDMESLLVEEIPLGREDEEAYYYCFGSACLYQRRIAFPIYREENICLFDIQTNEINRVYPSGVRKKYTHIFAIGNRLWLIPEKLYEGIDIWDIENKTIEQILELPDEITVLSRKHTNMDIRLGFLREDKLYLLAGGLECSIVIDVDSKIAVLWKLPHEYEEKDFLQGHQYLYRLRYLSVLQEEKRDVICGLRGEWIICEQGKAYVLEEQSQRNRELTFALSNIRPGEVICENETDLDVYITWKDGKKAGEQADNKQDTIGQIIYQLMSRQGG